MARPHDIWEFGWSQPYQDRDAYIRSLPEVEQEWATMLFHYIDLAFEQMIQRRLDKYYADPDKAGDWVQHTREWAKDMLEPPTDDRWKYRFREDSYKFYEGEGEE